MVRREIVTPQAGGGVKTPGSVVRQYRTRSTEIGRPDELAIGTNGAGDDITRDGRELRPTYLDAVAEAGMGQTPGCARRRPNVLAVHVLVRVVIVGMVTMIPAVIWKRLVMVPVPVIVPAGTEWTVVRTEVTPGFAPT